MSVMNSHVANYEVCYSRYWAIGQFGIFVLLVNRNDLFLS